MMDGFDVTENWFERVVVVTPVGEIDLLTAPQFRDAIYRASRKEPAAMIVDLTRVTFLASAGMNLLLAMHREVTRSAQFGIVADAPTTSRPLTMTGIDRIVGVYRLLSAALDAFKEA
jgi:anti-sigma B factor antagonist